jgi:hypothetical protein
MSDRKRVLWAWAGAALSACATVPSERENGGVVEQAVVTTTVTATASLVGTVLTVTTSDMPKGWYTKGANFDGNKAPISLSWTVSASSCLAAAGGSATTVAGSFTPLLNPQNKPVGYSWSYSIDLAAHQNHWHNHIACGGAVSVEGCQEARTVNVTLSVAGACLETDGAVCTDTDGVVLASVQDPDVVDGNCGCNIGACVSACQAACNDASCGKCCECGCKAQALAGGNSACAPQSLCYSGSPGHPACL